MKALLPSHGVGQLSNDDQIPTSGRAFEFNFDAAFILIHLNELGQFVRPAKYLSIELA